MLVASVIVDIPARAIDKPFDYFVPEQIASDLQIGCVVSVEFGNRPVVAYVVDLREDEVEAFTGEGRAQEGTLKPVLGVLSEGYFDEVSADVARWISHEYLCPLSDAIHLFTPPGGTPKIRRQDDEWTLVRAGIGAVDDRWVSLTDAAADFVPAGNATKQKRVLDALACGGMRVAELSIELGSVNATLKSLEKHGVVSIEHRRRMRQAMEQVQVPDVELQTLTAGQTEALEAIADAGPGGVVVCDGITGSGKTEVYLRAIASVLEKGKSACVLVPEISLTPQTVGRFRARFGDTVAVLHSHLSLGERFDQWDLIRSGTARVVVGARSALFAPLRELGLIVIDEEHESSYKQDRSPRYAARDVAVHMAELRGAVLVLGSATPSIETLSACGACDTAGEADESLPGKGWRHALLPERPNGRPLPPVSVVDMGAEFGDGHRSMFSRELQDCLMQTLQRREKAVLLLNQRGFASFLLCRECGYVPECPDCSTSLTYHETGNLLQCHHCNHTESMPAKCPHCGSVYLRKFGAGTERVESELRELLPDEVRIVRMDSDTTKGKGAHERLLEDFASAPSAVLLGTQMIAKGLDFPDVTLVGVVNADTTLNLPDFRAGERTYQLLEQVSGRAGRAEKPGRVIVQTYRPDAAAIRAAAVHDRRLFLNEELPLRKELGYPPYRRLANILMWGKDESAVRKEISALTLNLQGVLESAGLDWEVLGPAPCVISRRRGLYRWHTLIKAPPASDIAAILEPMLARRKPNEEVRFAVDMDPYDLY